MMRNNLDNNEITTGGPAIFNDVLPRWSMLSCSTRRAWLVAAIALAVISFAIGAWQANRYHDAQRRLAESARAQAQAESRRGSAAIDEVLRRVSAHAVEVAADLHTGKTTRGMLAERLRNTLYSDPDIAEIGVAFTPFSWDPGIRLHGIAYTLNGRNIEPRMLDEAHDYTEQGTAWYQQPLAAQAPVWIVPTRLESSGTRVAIYALPFQLPDAAQSSGVVYVAYALDRLDAILDTLKLSAEDYGYVLSAQGVLLAHPNRDYIENPASFVPPSVQKIVAEIPTLGGSLVVTVNDAQAYSPRMTRRILAGIGLAFGLGVLLLAVAAVQFDQDGPRRNWSISIACSAALLAAIVFVLVLAERFPDQGGQGETPIPTQSALKRFVAEQDRAALTSGQPLPLPLPTGIMVQSVTFLSGKDLRVTGYVWQRYSKGLHDGVTRGFLIPESDAFDATEIYRERRPDGEVIGWSFRAVLHVEFDNRHFPFDVQNVRIPLWPKDFYRNVLLVPDLDAYPLAMPEARPGLRQGLTMPNWDIETASFGYAPRTYKARFGFDAQASPANLPELGFTISGRKQITGPFVTYLLPIAVVLTMLFILLILSNRDEKRIKLLGFDAMKVISACAGFFLVVIFSEVDLRKTLATKDIVYLEYFHFTAYTAILAVAISAIVFVHDKGVPRNHHDNYYAKRFYWPMVLLLILSFTLATFI